MKPIALAGLAMVLAACTGAHRPAAQRVSPVAGAPAPPQVVDGLRFTGEVTWSDPVLDETDARVILVYATGVHSADVASWGPYCETTPVARVTEQTASTVVVAVDQYARPPRKIKDNNGTILCDGRSIGLARSPIRVTLTQPLGARSLVDAADGGTRPVLDPASVLKPTYLPAGFAGGAPRWGSHPASAAVREYTGPGSTLMITVAPDRISQVEPHLITRTHVRGHPATVTNTKGFEQDILIAWNETTSTSVTVYQVSNYDRKHRALGVPELLKIANSLR